MTKKNAPVVALGVMLVFALQGACTGDGGMTGDGTEEIDCERDFIIQDAEEMDALKACERVTGRILVLESDVTQLVLPRLTLIDGSLEIWQNNSLETVELPQLQQVLGSDLTIAYNEALEEVHLPEVTRAGERLRIYENNRLHTVQLSSLSRQEGALWVIRCASLETLDLANLAEVGGAEADDETEVELLLENLPQLSAVNLPLLEVVDGNLNIAATERLAHIQLPRLQQINGSLILYQNLQLELIAAPELTSGVSTLSIFDNPLLTSVDLSKVEEVSASLYLASHALIESVDLSALSRVGSAFQLSANDQLTEVHMNLLEAVGGDFEVVQNPQLPQCLVSQWRDFILSNGGIGGDIEMLGNDEEAECSESGS